MIFNFFIQILKIKFNLFFIYFTKQQLQILLKVLFFINYFNGKQQVLSGETHTCTTHNHNHLNRPKHCPAQPDEQQPQPPSSPPAVRAVPWVARASVGRRALARWHVRRDGPGRRRSVCALRRRWWLVVPLRCRSVRGGLLVGSQWYWLVVVVWKNHKIKNQKLEITVDCGPNNNSLLHGLALSNAIR